MRRVLIVTVVALMLGVWDAQGSVADDTVRFYFGQLTWQSPQTASLASFILVTDDVVAERMLPGGEGNVEACHPCQPGQVTRVGGALAGIDLGQGWARMAGTIYQVTQYFGYLRFDGEAVMLPDQPPLPSRWSVTSSFSMQGSFGGCSSGGIMGSDCQVLFDLPSVSGFGAVTLWYDTVRSGPDVWYELRRIEYAFDPRN